MATRKSSKSKQMTGEHAADENDYDIAPDQELEASVENAVEPVALNVESPGAAPSVEAAVEALVQNRGRPVEAAAEAIPQPGVGAVEAVAEVVAEDPTPEPEARAPRAIEAAAVVALDFAAPVKAASEWRKATAAAWNEGAAALIDLASALTKARTVSEVVDLQARFAQERLEGLAKLSSDYVELAQRTAKDAGAGAFRFSKPA